MARNIIKRLGDITDHEYMDTAMVAAYEIEQLEMEVAAWRQASSMKADEIKRLREEIERLREKNGQSDELEQVWEMYAGLQEEVKRQDAEIEQLRALQCKLVEHERGCKFWEAAGEIKRLEAEIDRLRAALREIADYKLLRPGAVPAKAIARRALDGEKE